MPFSTICKGERPFAPPKCGVFFELSKLQLESIMNQLPIDLDLLTHRCKGTQPCAPPECDVFFEL